MMIVAKSVLLATSVAAVLGIGAAAGKVYNQTFTPWTVMGPVRYNSNAPARPSATPWPD